MPERVAYIRLMRCSLVQLRMPKLQHLWKQRFGVGKEDWRVVLSLLHPGSTWEYAASGRCARWKRNEGNSSMCRKDSTPHGSGNHERRRYESSSLQLPAAWRGIGKRSGHPFRHNLFLFRINSPYRILESSTSALYFLVVGTGFWPTCLGRQAMNAEGL